MLATVIVKIYIPKIKTAVLTNLLIFGKNSSHKASVCLRGGGGLKCYLDKDRLNRAFFVQGLPLGCWIDLHSMMKLWKHDNEAKIGQQVMKRFQNAES